MITLSGALVMQILLWFFAAMVAGYFAYTQGRDNGKHQGYLHGVEVGKHFGHKQGYRAAQVKAWTNILVTGEKVSLFINGKEVSPTLGVKPASSGAKAIGLWWLDGHIRDGFLSPTEADEEFALRMYAKDHNKILTKTGLNPDLTEEVPIYEGG